jgi:hypothetical protein
MVLRGRRDRPWRRSLSRSQDSGDTEKASKDEPDARPGEMVRRIPATRLQMAPGVAPAQPDRILRS